MMTTPFFLLPKNESATNPSKRQTRNILQTVINNSSVADLEKLGLQVRVSLPSYFPTSSSQVNAGWLIAWWQLLQPCYPPRRCAIQSNPWLDSTKIGVEQHQVAYIVGGLLKGILILRPACLIRRVRIQMRSILRSRTLNQLYNKVN